MFTILHSLSKEQNSFGCGVKTLYSFSANPKSDSPMGSLNFSRIENAQLQFTMNQNSKNFFKDNFLPTSKHNQLNENNHNIVIYAVNYNYLVIKGGMAGLAYKN